MVNGLAANSGFPRSEQTSPDELSRLFISYFPFGAPDERIDSRVARYHCMEAHRGVDTTYRRLFDTLPFSLSQPIPSKLDKLAVRLPGDFFENLEDLYSRSTLLPLYEQFGGDKFHQKERKELLCNLANFARTVTVDGVSTCICPQCIVDDDEEHGWPYIHRAHHVPGVTACWRHGLVLLSQCAECKCPFQPPLGLPLGLWRGCASCSAPLWRPEDARNTGVREVDVQYAKFVKAMLNVAPIRISSESLANLYRYQALTLGFGRKSTINRPALFKAIEDKFGAALLGRFDPDYRTSNSDAWFHVLGRGRQNGEVPISRHLFLSMFLFDDADNLINKLRLLAAGKLAEVNSAKVLKQRRQVKANSALEMPKENLLNDLARFARSEKLTIDELWKTRYGDMKRLVKKQPYAVKRLHEQIKMQLDEWKLASPKIYEALQNPHDAEWAKKVVEVLPDLYALDRVPKRVSMNTICKAAAFPRFVDQSWSPITYTELKRGAETIWHFYARRILWNVRQRNEKSIARHKAIYGLDFYRAIEVFDFLSDRFDELCKSGTPIPEALESMGVARDWNGPCPGKNLRRAGRAYQKVERPFHYVRTQ